MLFNSYEFLLAFLPVSLICYFTASRMGKSAPQIVLCVASLVFYGWWEPAFLLVLVPSILFNFFVSILIQRFEGYPKYQTWVLAFGVTANLLALFYYKYAMWLVGLLIDVGVSLNPLSEIVLPLGISFFTFTQIGYLIDCKNGTAKERGFVPYVLFVTFFPHLIAGPILHNQEVMPQFADRSVSRFNWSNFSVGLTIFLLGLFKKTVIADGVAPIAATGFADAGTVGAIPAWTAALAFSMQLYFDFSGYSDMAVGLARMFNIRFPLNFNSPFKAANIADFWQRWHITLTRYLNAFLYSPIAVKLTRRAMENPKLGKNPLATYQGFVMVVAIPTFWTMGLAGVWHGAGIQFLIFGLLHASYIVIYRGWAMWISNRNKARKKQGKPPQNIPRYLGVFIVLICATIANVFFYSKTLDQALSMLSAMMGVHGSGLAPSLYNELAFEAATLAVCLSIVWWFPNVYQIMGRYSPVIGKVEPFLSRFNWTFSYRWATFTGVVGAVAILAIGRAAEFLYFQF